MSNFRVQRRTQSVGLSLSSTSAEVASASRNPLRQDEIELNKTMSEAAIALGERIDHLEEKVVLRIALKNGLDGNSDTSTGDSKKFNMPVNIGYDAHGLSSDPHPMGNAMVDMGLGGAGRESQTDFTTLMSALGMQPETATEQGELHL
eukprot:gene352-15256_t